MTRALAALAIVVAVAAPLRADAPKSNFHFQVPAGWTDRSQPDMRDFLTLAQEEKAQLVFQAKVAPGGEPVNAAFLDKYAGDAQKSVARRLAGALLKVVHKEVTKVGGVAAARFVFELPAAEGQLPVRELQYYVPAGDQHAVLTFTAPPETFEKFVPLFDQTARATVVRK